MLSGIITGIQFGALSGYLGFLEGGQGGFDLSVHNLQGGICFYLGGRGSLEARFGGGGGGFGRFHFLHERLMGGLGGGFGFYQVGRLCLGLGEGGGQRGHGRFGLGGGILRGLGGGGGAGGGFLGGAEFAFDGLKRLGGIGLSDERLRHGDFQSAINGLNRHEFDGRKVVVLFLRGSHFGGLGLGGGLGLSGGGLGGLQIGLGLFHGGLAGGDHFLGFHDLCLFQGHFGLRGGQGFVGLGFGVLSFVGFGLQSGFGSTEIPFLGGGQSGLGIGQGSLGGLGL